MNYLLDTCVISESTRTHANDAVLNWIAHQAPESLYLSVISIAELARGVARLPASARKTRLTDFLDETITHYRDRILPLTTQICRRWGELCGTLDKKGRVLPLMDSLLAATAAEHGLLIATRNIKDFADTGIDAVDIWNSKD